MKKLVDNYNRQITYMRISITDRCNLRCKYCVPPEGISWMDHDTILSYEEILRIIRVAAQKGLTKIRITGGEPLIRKGVVDFISEIGRIEGIKDLAMTTNAVFLKEYALPLYNAGLRRLNISLDSLKPEKFYRMTRGNVFWRVWEGIEKALEIGFHPIKLNAVLQRGENDDEVIDFVKMTLDKPFHVRFIEYMPMNDLEDWKKYFMPTAEIIKLINDELGGFYPMGAINGNHGPSNNYRLEGAKGQVGFIHAISEHFCGSCNRIRLTADGMIKPCLFSDLEIDFKKALREGCSDEDISTLLDQVLFVKPEGHKLDTHLKERKRHNMANIGG